MYFSTNVVELMFIDVLISEILNPSKKEERK